MACQDSLHTDMRQAPGWYAILPPPAPAIRLKGRQVADWVVVGAGVTGLAAARRLGDLAPEARILLLDSYRVGYGASGRNAGFIIDTPHLTETFDHDDNKRVSRLVTSGLAELEGHVKKYGIDCEWSAIGHLTSAVQPERERNLRATVRTLEAVGEPYEWLNREALAKVVGTDYYHAAVLTPRTVLLNPAALCRGLGEHLPANVEVFEETPVLEVGSGSPLRIECAEGSIVTANVLLTTNAFITELDYLKRGVFPLVGCGSLTRPLNDEEQAAIGGEPEWGVTGVTTMRRTRSNRILVRQGTYHSGDFRLSAGRRRKLVHAHSVILKQRFPVLDKLEFEHTWAGVYCMTRDWASHFGRLEPGVFASLGYCGVGLPRGTASGTLLADYAMGAESDLIRDVQALSGPKRLPPKPFLDLGIKARLAWYRWKSRKES